MKELLTLIIQNIKSFEESMKFRKGQKPFYDKIIEGLKKDWTTMFIKGPTGMGKTFLQAVLAAAIIGDSNIKVLLLTSKITLLKQIQGEFVKFVGFLSTGLFGGGFKDHHQQVTIMTYASYQRQKESFIKQFKVLLLDEGHRGLAVKTKIQLEKQKEFSILIGFTASDEYSKEKSLTQFLVNKAHELSIEEAVELGMLSNIKVMIASVDIEISGQAENESKGDYETRISSDIISQGGNIATARLYKRVFAKRNLRGICLVLTTNQGNDLVTQFANENIKAELIHSGLIRTEREDMFTRFRNNEFTVLIGMGIIKEGFNDPAVSVAITTYPVGSRVDMTQFPGRAERIDDDNPDKVAYVVNLAYKNKKQLFYTNVLDGKSEILQKQSCRKKLDIISRSEMRSAIARNPESFITSVAVDEEEVMEIMRSYESVEFLSYEELKKEVQENAIKTTTAYVEIQKLHSNWPADLRVYKDQYSHEDFFGLKYLSYEDLKAEVKAANIKTVNEYLKVRKLHCFWASDPWSKYKDQYSHEDFFGLKYLSYKNLKKAVQAAGIDNTGRYREIQKLHDNWPSIPRRTYKNQYSFEDFFATEKKVEYLPYEILKKAVQDAGIDGIVKYKQIQKIHSNWRSDPATTFKGQYSCKDFFGSKFLQYEELKIAIQKAGISLLTLYIKKQKSHDNWPSEPWNNYKDQYSHEDFFGKKK